MPNFELWYYSGANWKVKELNIQIDDSEFPTRDINVDLKKLLNEKLEKVYAGKAANPFADEKDKNGKRFP